MRDRKLSAEANAQVAVADGFAALRAIAPASDYPPGIQLFRQGESLETVYFIEHGMVKLLISEPNGRMVIAAIRYPGWLVGAGAVFARRSNVVTGETLSHCRLRSLPTSAFRELIRTDLVFSEAVHEKHGEEICDSIERAGSSVLDAEHRLLRLLREYCAAETVAGSQTGPRFIVRLKRYELAQAAFMSAEHLSRVLKTLERDDVICRAKGSLIIPESRRLADR